jgi:hypothetical protein
MRVFINFAKLHLKIKWDLPFSEGLESSIFEVLSGYETIFIIVGLAVSIKSFYWLES